MRGSNAGARAARSTHVSLFDIVIEEMPGGHVIGDLDGALEVANLKHYVLPLLLLAADSCLFSHVSRARRNESVDNARPPEPRVRVAERVRHPGRARAPPRA